MKQPRRNPQSNTPPMIYATTYLLGALRTGRLCARFFLPHLAENNQKYEQIFIATLK